MKQCRCRGTSELNSHHKHSSLPPTDYKKNTNTDPPNGEQMIQVYKKGFGGKNQLTRAMTEADRRLFYWFVTSVTPLVSCKIASSVEYGPKKKGMKTYRERVTVTDEAYALMVMEHHNYKWKEREGNDKKKRVTGESKDESRKYYMKKTKELSEYRKANDDKYKVAEEWLQEMMDKEKEEEGGNKQKASGNKRKEDIDDNDTDGNGFGMSIEIDLNPHIQEIV